MDQHRGRLTRDGIRIHEPAEFAGMRRAGRLAAEILESKKRLVTIYSTHAHPDHLFGLAVLKQAFPDAKIVALPATVTAAKTGWPGCQKFWVATYGNNIPGPEPVLPEELATPVLTLEGQELPITGGVQGSDGPGNSFVWVPSLKAVITGGTSGPLIHHAHCPVIVLPRGVDAALSSGAEALLG